MSEIFDKSQMSETIDVPAGWLSAIICMTHILQITFS